MSLLNALPFPFSSTAFIGYWAGPQSPQAQGPVQDVTLEGGRWTFTVQGGKKVSVPYATTHLYAYLLVGACTSRCSVCQLPTLGERRCGNCERPFFAAITDSYGDPWGMEAAGTYEGMDVIPVPVPDDVPWTENERVPRWMHN